MACFVRQLKFYEQNASKRVKWTAVEMSMLLLWTLVFQGNAVAPVSTQYSNITIDEISQETQTIGRTERSHDNHDLLIEPRGRPGDKKDDPHFRPYFDEETETNVTCQFTKTAYLHCRIRQLGDRVVSWVRQRDLHILTVGAYTYTTDQRFTCIHMNYTDDWTLEIKELRKSDAGVYECQISAEPKLSLAINLNVIVVQARIAEGPALYIKSSSPVNLTCIVTDQVGTKFIFWYHNGHVVDAEKKSGGIKIFTEIGPTTVSRLFISAAQPSDSGNYTCQPSYSDPASITLQVLIDEKPAAMQHGPNGGLMSKSYIALVATLSFVVVML